MSRYLHLAAIYAATALGLGAAAYLTHEGGDVRDLILAAGLTVVGGGVTVAAAVAADAYTERRRR